MSEMTNPMDALNSLQQQVRQGLDTIPGDKYPGLRVVVDRPNGELRYTYAKIAHGRVKAMVTLMMNDPVGGIVRFSLGYAVPEAYRNRGLATEIVQQSVEELRLGLARKGMNCFFLDAVVGESNIASHCVAAKIFPDAPMSIIDAESGETAFAYDKLIELKEFA